MNEELNTHTRTRGTHALTYSHTHTHIDWLTLQAQAHTHTHTHTHTWHTHGGYTLSDKHKPTHIRSLAPSPARSVFFTETSYDIQYVIEYSIGYILWATGNQIVRREALLPLEEMTLTSDIATHHNHAKWSGEVRLQYCAHVIVRCHPTRVSTHRSIVNFPSPTISSSFGRVLVDET